MSLLDSGGRADLEAWLMKQPHRPHSWKRKKLQHMDLLIELELNIGLASGQKKYLITYENKSLATVHVKHTLSLCMA